MQIYYYQYANIEDGRIMWIGRVDAPVPARVVIGQSGTWIRQLGYRIHVTPTAQGRGPTAKTTSRRSAR